MFDPSEFEYEHNKVFDSLSKEVKSIFSGIMKKLEDSDQHDLAMDLQDVSNAIHLSIEQASYDAFSEITAQCESQKSEFLKKVSEASEAISLLQKYDSALDQFFTINGRYFDYKSINEGVEVLSIISEL